MLTGAAALVMAGPTSLDPKEPPGPPAQRVTGRPYAATWLITSDWTILRNQPVGLAIGNGRSGWPVDGPERVEYGYVNGFVGGSFGRCAWTSRRNVRAGSGSRSPDCGGRTIAPESFIARINCIRCSSGTAVRLVADAVEYANWSPDDGSRDPLRRVPAGRCVEWRWVGKGGRMAMVKDRTYPNNRGSWVFVPRSSLPHDLPTGYGSRCRSRVQFTSPKGP